MLGQLPTTLKINGKDYKIRSDYRNILRIFVALNSDELSDEEKTYVFLKRMYVDFPTIPKKDIEAAYEAAFAFIENNEHGSHKRQPRLVDWEKDEPLVFAAINKVAGKEIRAVEYLHWWTFLGYFQCIDREDTWGAVLTIRQKRARHKKLEKYESEFFNANREMCELESSTSRKKEADDFAKQLQRELLQGGEQ